MLEWVNCTVKSGVFEVHTKFARLIMDCSKQKTAKIYAFPPRRKSQKEASQLGRLEREAQAYSQVDFGSGWYHDDAIAESVCKESR